MSYFDDELPGMWEPADFQGGLVVVRGPHWQPPPPFGPEPVTLIEPDADPILAEYAGCPVFERHGDCACSTGIGVGCARPKRQRSEEEG